MHRARLYSSGPDHVQCHLCHHRCKIKEGRRGICGVRENRQGQLYSLVYGRPVAEHIDPIEKKPLFHFLPGSLSYSISTRGCNFTCLHCQNSSISQVKYNEDPVGNSPNRSPEEVIRSAKEAGCGSISYTYVEPTVFFEYAVDCAREASDAGIKNIFVSNGYMTTEAASELGQVLDAINIDIKAFSDEFYQKVCGARLQPVLDNLRLLYDLGVWVEVTTLLIPGMNDSPAELENIARFIVDTDPTIPWHITAFYPTYKLRNVPPAPASSLLKAREIGLAAGVNYVYTGNIAGSGGENTSCKSCGEILIRRHGFAINQNRLQHGCCPSCKAVIEGIWSE